MFGARDRTQSWCSKKRTKVSGRDTKGMRNGWHVFGTDRLCAESTAPLDVPTHQTMKSAKVLSTLQLACQVNAICLYRPSRPHMQLHSNDEERRRFVLGRARHKNWFIVVGIEFAGPLIDGRYA